MSGLPLGSIPSVFSPQAGLAWRWRSGWTRARNRLIWATSISPACSPSKATKPISLNGQKRRWACFMPTIIPTVKRPPHVGFDARHFTNTCSIRAQSWANLPDGSAPIGSPLAVRKLNTNTHGNARTSLTTSPRKLLLSAPMSACMICHPLAKSGSRAAMRAAL